jgi:hypothetical protein
VHPGRTTNGESWWLSPPAHRNGAWWRRGHRRGALGLEATPPGFYGRFAKALVAPEPDVWNPARAGLSPDPLSLHAKPLSDLLCGQQSVHGTLLGVGTTTQRRPAIGPRAEPPAVITGSTAHICVVAWWATSRRLSAWTLGCRVGNAAARTRRMDAVDDIRQNARKLRRRPASPPPAPPGQSREIHELEREHRRGGRPRLDLLARLREHAQELWLVGTLPGDCTITFANVTPPARALLLLSPSGPNKLVISYGGVSRELGGLLWAEWGGSGTYSLRLR